MINSLVILAIVQPHFITGLANATDGYRWTRVRELSGNVQVLDESDRTRVDFHVRRYSADKIDRQFKGSTGMISPRYSRTTSVSGLPFGRRMLFSDDKYGYQVVTHSRRHYVVCNYSGHVARVDGRWRNLTPTTDQDRLDVEGIARRALALADGQLLGQGNTISFAGSSLSTRTAESGSRMVKLSEWAQRRGVTVQWNRRLGAASFTRNGCQVIVPLGAEKMKVGTEWIELGEAVSMVGSDWWVSLDGIERSGRS